MRRRAALLVVLLAVAPACNPDIRDGMGPRVPIPNVEGSVLRGDLPAPGLSVALRTGAGQELASTTTTTSGSYGFDHVATGAWEVKVTGRAVGDFESVTRPFDLADSTIRVRAIDISAHGAALLEPADGASQPVPGPVQPVVFRWNLPSLPGVGARAQVFDAAGIAVWYSGSLTAGEVGWNGLGNQGSYQGALVPAGSYEWRVKFDLPDSSQAKTATRRLVLT